jgi:hypothetical protein
MLERNYEKKKFGCLVFSFCNYLIKKKETHAESFVSGTA